MADCSEYKTAAQKASMLAASLDGMLVVHLEIGLEAMTAYEMVASKALMKVSKVAALMVLQLAVTWAY